MIETGSIVRIVDCYHHSCECPSHCPFNSLCPTHSGVGRFAVVVRADDFIKVRLMNSDKIVTPAPGNLEQVTPLMALGEALED